MTLFETHRPLMFGIAYRMLGSVMEAEDALQDAFLRVQQMQDPIENPRAFFTTLMTRLCINRLNSARYQREQYLGEWLPEPLATSEPEHQTLQKDAISMAFLVLLERLNPAERAIFLLREVFDFEYGEIARMVDKSEAACRQVFSRAKRQLDTERTRFQVTVEEHRHLLQRFMEAVGSGDLHGLVALLTDDAVMLTDGGGKATATLYPLYGAPTVAQFLIGIRKHKPANGYQEIKSINGKPALVIRHEDGRAFAVINIECEGGHIRAVHAISNPDKLRHI